MTQMLLIDERTDIEIPDASLIGACLEALDITEETSPDTPSDELLDEVLAARCGSL